MALNNDTPWPSVVDAKLRVLSIQRKLHQWSKTNSERRFNDLYNLVCDRATLLAAWERVRSNRGSRTAGLDGWTRWHIEQRVGVAPFLEELRSQLKARTYRPTPVRERGIPKRGGKVRYLGIPTIRDRVVQMALKLVLSSRSSRPTSTLRVMGIGQLEEPRMRLRRSCVTSILVPRTNMSSRATSRRASTTSGMAF